MDFGKMLIVFGIFMIIAGVAIGFSSKFFLLGQLPGDIHCPGERRSFSFLSSHLSYQYCRNNSFKSVFLENKNIFI